MHQVYAYSKSKHTEIRKKYKEILQKMQVTARVEI